ncbi:rCG43561 [Rattus norvegicus]|uniref:RCG43561 n=1 Tax=Rattus norvegicus TaxID=10116 RepID=A6JJC4_RAT|nr:rCG43561 [Rattus norvegicus]
MLRDRQKETSFKSCLSNSMSYCGFFPLTLILHLGLPYFDLPTDLPSASTPQGKHRMLCFIDAMGTFILIGIAIHSL